MGQARVSARVTSSPNWNDLALTQRLLAQVMERPTCCFQSEIEAYDIDNDFIVFQSEIEAYNNDNDFIVFQSDIEAYDHGNNRMITMSFISLFFSLRWSLGQWQ